MRAEKVGSFGMLAAVPVAASMASGSVGEYWANVENAQPSLGDAFVSDDILAAAVDIGPGTVELDFGADGAYNGAEDDLVLFNLVWEPHTYAVSADHDGFSAQYTPSLSGTGVAREYYTNENRGEPVSKSYSVGYVNLSSIGAPAGTVVQKVRVSGVTSHAELLGVGALHSRPRVNVAATRPQAAEGTAVEAAKGQFTFYRDGDDSAELVVPYTVGSGPGQATPGTNADYTPLTGTVTIPAGLRSVTVEVDALPDADSEPVEAVHVNIDQPAAGAKYARGHQVAAKVDILDKKKYLLAYYGAGPTLGFGNQWLEQTAIGATTTYGYEPVILYTENREKGLMTEFFQKINADGNKRISKAEVESAEVRMLGYSWGGVQIINTSRKFTGVDKQFYGYKLEGEIEVQSLVTIDPVNFFQPFKRANGPVKENVQKYRNYYQRVGGKSSIRKVDPVTGQTTNVWDTWGNWLSVMLRGSVMDSVVPDSGSPDQKRVDTLFADVAVERDYEYEFFDGSTGRGRLYGNDVNHDTMPWWSHKRVIDDLA